MKTTPKQRAQASAWAAANPERRREHSRKYAQSDKRHHRDLMAKYGITLAEYEATLEAQGGVCAICGGVDNRRLNVDHCHKTGRVRGLLCTGCNGASLGKLGHDPERAEARAEYHEERAFRLRRVAEYLRNPPGVKRG